jgi:Na+-driven multidrug efflux pump
MTTLLAVLDLVAQAEGQEKSADVAEEGLHIIIGMLIVGLVFLAVILLGQLGRYLTHRRHDRKAAQRVY